MSARPLRVLHLLNTVRETGNGIINTAVDLAWGEARLGHEVHVASGGGEFEPRFAEWGITHHALDQRRGPVTLLRAAGRLRALLTALRPDVVHAHMNGKCSTGPRDKSSRGLRDAAATGPLAESPWPGSEA